MSKEKTRIRMSEEERIAKISDNLDKALEKKAMAEDSLKKINSKIAEYRASLDKYNRKKFERLKTAKGLSWEELFAMMNRGSDDALSKNATASDKETLEDKPADSADSDEVFSDDENKNEDDTREQDGLLNEMTAELLREINADKETADTDASMTPESGSNEKIPLYSESEKTDMKEDSLFLKKQPDSEAEENSLGNRPDACNIEQTDSPAELDDHDDYDEQVSMMNRWVDEDSLN